MDKDEQSDAGARKYDVGYMQRTREFYSAQGYTNHYQWAKNTDSPFTALTKPLKDCKVAVITNPYRRHRFISATTCTRCRR